jgi:uncharacterized membrane protein YeaQ/YmgE (transglycosylase-associated protein family)
VSVVTNKGKYIMGWLAWIVVGAVAGWAASMVMGTNRRQGLIMDIIVGIAGAFIGGMVFNALGQQGLDGFSIWSLFVAFIGAIILLGIIRLFNGRGLRV